MIEINLLPGAKRKRGAKRAALALPDFKRLAGLVRDPWLVACVGSWAVVLGLVFGLYLPRRAAVAALGSRLESVKNESRRLEGVLALKRRFEAKRDTLQSEISLIRGIDHDRYVWPHLLEAVAQALTPYTWLEDIQARTVEGDAAGTPSFQLQGKSVDLQAVTRFIRNLEDSPFIEGVQPVSTVVVIEQGRDVTSFMLNARYQVPDTSILTMQPLSASLVQGVRSGGGGR